MQKLIAGIVFLFISSILFFVLTKPMFTQALGSKNWPSTIGTVVKSHVDSNAGEDNNMYALRFQYDYYIDGRKYTTKGRYFTYGEGSQSWKGNLYEYAAEHPVGSTIPIFYNPAKPTQSTVEKGIPWYFWLLGAFNAIFFWGGIACIFFPNSVRISNQ